MEWIVAIIGLAVALSIGFVLGVFLCAYSFISKIGKQGFSFKNGKIVRESTMPLAAPIVVNFPAGMDEEKAERVLKEVLGRATTTANVEFPSLTIEDVERMLARRVLRGY